MASSDRETNATSSLTADEARALASAALANWSANASTNDVNSPQIVVQSPSETDDVPPRIDEIRATPGVCGRKSGKVTFLGTKQKANKKAADRCANFLQTDEADASKIVGEIIRDQWLPRDRDKAFKMGISLVESIASTEATRTLLEYTGFVAALKLAQKTTNAFLLSFGISNLGGIAVGSIPEGVPSACADALREFTYDERATDIEAQRKLESHHSAILIYDDGSRLDDWINDDITRSLLRFRAQLEEKLCAEVGGFDVPVVRVVFGDRFCLIHEVFRSVIDSQLPVVVLKGTGKVPAFFEALMTDWPTRKWSSKEEKEEYDAGLCRYFVDHFADEIADDARKKNIKEVNDVVSKVDTFVGEANAGMLVFADTRRDPRDLSLALLAAVAAQLKHRRPFSDDVGYNLLLSAFASSDHKSEMLNIFADRKVNFGELFCFDRVKELFGALDMDSIEARLRLKSKSNASLQSRLHVILCKLLKLDPKRDRTVFFSPGKPFDAPNPEGDALLIVFVWAILNVDQELATTCWSLSGKEPMTAMIATMTFNSFLEFFVNKEDREHKWRRYQECKNEFEDLATDEVIHAFANEPKRALMLIEKRYKLWGTYNCLQLAQLAEDERSWRQGLTCSHMGVLFGIFCPLYVIFCMKFDVEKYGYKTKKEFNWREKLTHFFTTPVTKFSTWALAYTAFVAVYSTFMLFGYRPVPTYWEVLVNVWFFFAMIESLRSAFVTLRVDRCVIKWSHFVSNLWRQAETVACLCHIAGLVFRVIPYDNCFEFARVLFSATALLQFLRLLEYCVVFRAFGPKIYVVVEIMPQVFHILLMLMTVTMGYAVASQSLIFPHREIYGGIFFDLLYHPYFQLFGELNLEFSAQAKVHGCDGTTEVNMHGEPCQLSQIALKALSVHLAVFLVFAMLLLNLLIAIFTIKIARVEENAVEIWRSQKWRLSFEFRDKSAFPPPLTLPVQIIRFVCSQLHNLYTNCCVKKQQLSNRHRPSLTGAAALVEAGVELVMARDDTTCNRAETMKLLQAPERFLSVDGVDSDENRNKNKIIPIRKERRVSALQQLFKIPSKAVLDKVDNQI